MALPPRRPSPCATCRVTCMWRHSATKAAVSKPLSPPTVTRRVHGICSNITTPYRARPSRSPPTPWHLRLARYGFLPADCRCSSTWPPCPRLCGPLRLRIGLRFVGPVGPLLPVKVHGRTARIIRPGRMACVAALKALGPSPGFQQGAVHGEVFVGG